MVNSARDLLVPRLAHDGDHRAPPGHEVGQPAVVLGGDVLLHVEPNAAMRMLKRHLLHALEERDVFRVRCRKPALDEIDAERVQAPTMRSLSSSDNVMPSHLLSVSRVLSYVRIHLHRGAPSLKKRSPPAGRKQRTAGLATYQPMT